MKLEPCIGCGRMVLIHRVANLTVKCDPTPLTDVGEIVRLLTSPNPPSLWMVERNQQGQPVRLRGARPGEAGPVREHRCTPVSRPNPAPSVVAPPKGPSSPPERRVAPSTPSSVRPTARSGAPAAASPRSDGGGPRCDECGIIMGEGDYVAVQLGEIYVWAQHLTNCGR